MTPTSTNQPIPSNLADSGTEFLSRHSTKVMIQEAATQRYLSASGLWTANPNEAMTFRSGSAAMEHLTHTQRRLPNLRFVLTRDITVKEIIPVTNSLLSSR